MFVVVTLPAASVAVKVNWLEPAASGRFSIQNFPSLSTMALAAVRVPVCIRDRRLQGGGEIVHPPAQSKVAAADLRSVLRPIQLHHRRIGPAGIAQRIGEIGRRHVAGQVGGVEGQDVVPVGQRNVKGLESVGGEFPGVGRIILVEHKGRLIGEEAGRVAQIVTQAGQRLRDNSPAPRSSAA